MCFIRYDKFQNDTMFVRCEKAKWYIKKNHSVKKTRYKANDSSISIKFIKVWRFMKRFTDKFIELEYFLCFVGYLYWLLLNMLH